MSIKVISDDYKATLEEGHASYGKFGITGYRFSGIVNHVMDTFGCVDVLDYGCGKGTLAPALLKIRPGTKIAEYDPGIPGKDALPEPADLVCAFDCLEHVEPHLIDEVMNHLESLVRRVLLVAIPTKPSGYVLPDGRNAHLVVMPQIWWLAKLMSHFELQHFERHPQQVQFFAVLLHPELAWSPKFYRNCRALFGLDPLVARNHTIDLKIETKK